MVLAEEEGEAVWGSDEEVHSGRRVFCPQGEKLLSNGFGELPSMLTGLHSLMRDTVFRHTMQDATNVG